MNRRLIYFSLLLTCSFLGQLHAQKKVVSFEPAMQHELVQGDFRILELEGRKGVHLTSIHSLLKFPQHTLNNPTGTMSFWVFSLEDVFAYHHRDVIWTKGNKNPWMFPYLQDHPDPGNYDAANFSMAFETGWHPAFVTKFYKGNIFTDAIAKPRKAYAMASAFEMKPNKWYQFTLTWDFPNKEIMAYVNGVPIASSDRFTEEFHRDPTGDTLYAGKSIYCFGELSFYQDKMTDKEVKALFEKQSIHTDEDFQHELEHTFGGKHHKEFVWEPNEEWSISYMTDLKNDTVLDDFYIQGVVDKVEVGDEGLRIKTLPVKYRDETRAQQMYLWHKEAYEGDVYIEYDFRANQDFGLALLMIQASGMNREDFMKDYPLRTDGSMKQVHSSDIRNYHIEFYRHMNAVRNDVDNVAMVKNPYQLPLGFGTFDRLLEVNKWHKFQILQQGNTFICAIDGEILFEATDKRFANNGPVLNYGYFALRCMVNTDMTFRNLKVMNKKMPFTLINK